MVRFAAVFAFLALALNAPAQTFSHGAPASVVSPTPDGREHGIPAGATSPTPLPPGVNPPLRPVFVGRHQVRPVRRDHRREVLVPVPIFYNSYGPLYDYGYPSPADPQVDPAADPDSASASSDASVGSSEEALRYAYLQGARDALAQEKERDKDSARMKPSPAKRDPFAPAAKSAPDPKPEADSSPATVFIFKDGRKIETKNFAIMGTTLYDMSGPTLKKVQLTDLDTEATMKANDGNGITVKLP
jgi:hypothetical protein